MKICLVIPHFDHLEQFRKILPKLVSERIPLVVVDDASTDESPAILKALHEKSPIPFELELLEENQKALNFNRALAMCRGEYLAACASDDVLLPDALEKLVEVMEADDRVQIVFGNGWTLSEGKLRKEPLYQGEMADVLKGPTEGILRHLQKGLNPFWIQSSLMRTGLVKAAGGQTEEAGANDGEFVRRIFTYMVERGFTHAFVDVPVFAYRLHENNMHKDPEWMREGIEYSVETQFEGLDKTKIYHENLTGVMRSSLESNDVKEAVRTLSFLLDKLDDEKLVQFYRNKLFALVEELGSAQRDSESGEWDAGIGLEEERAKQKSKIAEQRERIAKYRSLAEKREDELRQLKRSVWWKIGRFWTKPFRLLFGRN